MVLQNLGLLHVHKLNSVVLIHCSRMMTIDSSIRSVFCIFLNIILNKQFHVQLNTCVFDAELNGVFQRSDHPVSSVVLAT